MERQKERVLWLWLPEKSILCLSSPEIADGEMRGFFVVVTCSKTRFRGKGDKPFSSDRITATNEGNIYRVFFGD